MDKEHRDLVNRVLKETFNHRYPEMSKRNENELLPTIIWDYCKLYMTIKTALDPSPIGIASKVSR